MPAAFILAFLAMAGHGSPGIPVTFRVDMSEPAEKGLFDRHAGDRVVVRGSFNDWRGDELQLQDIDGDNIYSGSFALEADSGMTTEYKYVILKAAGAVFWEGMADPDNPPHGNRVLALAERDRNRMPEPFKINTYHLGAVGRRVEFTVRELQHDFVQFRRTLEENHCCLYEYTGKVTFDSLFDRQYGLIDGPTPPNQFFTILTPLTAKVGCMHTSLWMPGEYWDLDPDDLFPLQIRFIEDQVVVAGDYGGSEQVPYGSILLKINGRPVVDIIEEMRANYSADAFNPHFILSQIERRFPLLYARSWGFPEQYVISYLSPPDRKQKVAARLDPADLQSVRAVVFKNFNDPALAFEVDPQRDTAVMTVNTFVYYDRVEFFRSFIDSCFNIIHEQKINNLILDLRGNDGGDPFCAVPLFSYLEREPVPYFAEPYGKYAEFAEPIPLAEKHFTGNLFTLLDGRCGSTNGHFCSLLKYHKIGTFVGTPGGSTYKCNAGRDIEIQLDNTRFILNFGRNTFAAAVQGMDKTEPIMPDVLVTPTYRDFLERKDVFMIAAWKLIDSAK